MENNANANNNKPHLLYMTGLSIDKKRFNQITENICFDKDFKLWFDYIQSKTTAATTDLKQYLDNEGKNIANYGGTVIDFISLLLIGSKTYIAKPIIKKVIDMLLEDRNTLKTSSKTLLKFIDFSKKSINEYKIDDFFSLYLSHQSDSLGVMPLSQLANNKGFNFTNTYCDKDYYINKYIDSVIINLNEKYFKYGEDGSYLNIEEMMEYIFTTHLFDIYTSKIITQFEYEDENGKKLSLFENNIINQQYFEQMKKAFEERNFFGISLLSYFFVEIKNYLDKKGNKTQIKIFLHSDEENNEFLKELIEYSSSPDIIEFVKDENEAMLSIKLYESDGKSIINPDLNKDTEFKSYFGLEDIPTDYKHNMLISDYKKVGLLQRIIPNNNTKNVSYQHYEKNLVRIPIKMVLSLPRNKQGNADQSIYVPYMVDNKDCNHIDILTIGGAEHNRALAHLVNKHRIQHKEGRIYGFLDNYFDLELKLTKIQDHQYSSSFLMALNQPVAGYNAIFMHRTDDDKGMSVAMEAKVLAFTIKDELSRQYSIVTVYGLSALASVYATHNIVASFIDREDIKIPIFDSKDFYFENMKFRLNTRNIDPEEFKQKGLSAMFLYKKSTPNYLAETFDNKHALYIFNSNIDKYKKAFLYNDKIFDGIEYGTIDNEYQ